MKYYVCYYNPYTKKKLTDHTFTVFATRLFARIAKSRYVKNHITPQNRDLKIVQMPLKSI